MKKRLMLAAVLAAFVLVPMQATAKSGLNLSQLDSKMCNPVATLASVTYKMMNFNVAGDNGNTWANLALTAKVTYYATRGGACVITKYTGSFVTFAGDSPGGTGMVSSGRTGKVSGGYRTGVFPGYLLASPVYPLKGNLGTFDRQCSDAFHCPGTVPTINNFLAGYDSSIAWSGLQFDAKKPTQSWISSTDGESGDITG